jgi:hypothetical protein
LELLKEGNREIENEKRQFIKSNKTAAEAAVFSRFPISKRKWAY